MIITGMPDSARWCCRREEFRNVVTTRDQLGPDGVAKAIHERCAVCGNNHYILRVPPISLSVKGSSI